MNNKKVRRNRVFEKLCKMDQGTLKAYLEGEMENRGREVIKGDGFLYSPGTFPVLLCAHMDTVHKELPREICYENGKVSSPQGIGGDDRCGIYMILSIIRKVNCPAVFFEDEEIGGVGSAKFCKSETLAKVDVNYVIELDRKNGNDAVFYDQDNEEFEEFITREFWQTNWGSFTDICNICPELGVAGVNLSCGYYNQHTTQEYVVLAEMNKAIKEVIKLLNRTEIDTIYDYREARRYKSAYDYMFSDETYDEYDYGYGNYGNHNDYDGMIHEYEVSYCENGEEKLEYAFGKTYAEAFLDFFMAHGNICFNDIFYFVKV